MTIRTACFLLAVVSIGHWFMWVFIAASFVLPYIAVVMANAGSAADPEEMTAIDLAGDARQLPGPGQPGDGERGGERGGDGDGER
jgi:hypothetical protein